MKKKSLFSILASLAIIAGVITPPLTVNAEEPVVASIGDADYTSLNDAIEEVGKLVGATITMQRDVIVSGNSNRMGLKGANYNFTLDLNGKKIQQDPKELTADGLPNSKLGSPIYLSGGANLTVKDSLGGGEIYGHQAAVVVLDNSTFTLQNGELRGLWYGLSGNGLYHNTTININGGKISNNDPEKTGAAIYHPQTGKLNITGGVIIGDLGVQLCAGNGSIVNMNGGSITGTGENKIADKTGDGAIPDGAAISVVTRKGYGSVPTLNISGGVFKSEQSFAIMAYTWENNKQGVWDDASENVKISGGTFADESPAALLVAGSKLYASGTQFIVAPMATNIQLSPSEQSLEVGKNIMLQATLTPSNTLDTTTYSSSNKEIATVDNTGKVTAIATGTATITATVNGLSATSTITVVAVPTPTPTPTPEQPVVDIPKIDTTTPVKEVTIGVQDSASKEVLSNTVTSILDDISNGKTISTDVISEKTANAVKEALASGKTVNTKVSTELVDASTIDKITVDKVNEFVDTLAKENNKQTTIAQYLDLSVFLTADATELGNVYMLNKPIEFTVALPAELTKQDRSFYVVRIHNGVVEKLDTIVNTNGTLTFKSDKFSTFALVYEDIIPVQGGNDTVPPKQVPSSPATGIDNSVLPYYLIFAGAILLFGYSKQKKAKSKR